MDFKTAQQIRLLGKKIPKLLKRQGIIREKPLEEFKSKLKKDIVDNPKVDINLRRRVYNQIESGIYDKELEKINPKVAEKIDREMTKIVRGEMESGRLKPMPRCCILSQGRCRH